MAARGSHSRSPRIAGGTPGVGTGGTATPDALPAIEAARWLDLGFLALAVLPPLYLCALQLLSPLYATNDLFTDDAFYYFRIAANLASGHGSSFGGLVPTNGYHPLWQFLLVPLFALTGGGLAALNAVWAVASLSWVVCVILLRRIGLRCGLGDAFLLGGLFAALSASFIFPGGYGLLFIGMETTLVLPMLLLLVLRAAGTGLFAAVALSPASLLRTGLLLAALCLARLDCVMIAACVILGRLLVARRRLPPALLLRDALLLGLPIASVLLPYMAINQALFHSPMPISGVAKALGGPYLNPSPLLAALFGTDTLQRRTLPFGLVALLPFAAALAWRPGSVSAGPGRQVLRALAAILAGVALHLLYLSTASSWPIYSWYSYGIAVTGIVLVPLGLGAGLQRWAPGAARSRAVSGIVIACLLLGGAAALQRRLAHGDNSGSWWVIAPRDASRLDALLPKDAVIAMGDVAGTLAYWLDRRFVQTEGLVENRDWLAALGDDAKAAAYLRARHVSHIAAALLVLDPCPGAEAGCHVVTMPSWGRGPKAHMRVYDQDRVFHDTALTVWRYRPERQGLPPGS